jgi:hypothetical protein
MRGEKQLQGIVRERGLTSFRFPHNEQRVVWATRASHTANTALCGAPALRQIDYLQLMLGLSLASARHALCCFSRFAA